MFVYISSHAASKLRLGNHVPNSLYIHSYAYFDPTSYREELIFLFGISFRLFRGLTVGNGIPNDKFDRMSEGSARSYPLKENAGKNWGGTPSSTFYVCGSGAPLKFMFDGFLVANGLRDVVLRLKGNEYNFQER
jgi:hypothetical protein